MTTDDEDLDLLLREVLDDATARVAYDENELRRALADAIEAARIAKRLSVRQLAKAMHSSPSQVQRLLHKDLGGSITLRTLCRAAAALDCRIGIQLRPAAREPGVVVALGTTAWTPGDAVPPASRRLLSQAPVPAVMDDEWQEMKLRECG